MNEQTSPNQKRFDNLVTILIASVAIWVAITAYFQNYAANLSDQARRRAQQFAIEATKREINGVIQFSYDWQSAYQTWYELDLQITAAEQNGDTAAVQRFKSLQKNIIPLSKLLGPQYFDPNGGGLDTLKYESESYLVDATRLSETYLAESELGNFIDNTADALIVQITLLTVALSLYGLSLALSGRVRWLFVIVGSGIVGFCMIWMGWSLIEILGRPSVSHTAITAYAEGVGLAYQYRHDEAIEKFTLAIQEDPYYEKAYYQRAMEYYALGDTDKAIAEIEVARSNGLDDVNLNWNLGWMYYLTGQYDKAIETNERVLSTRPEVIGMRMNQALNYLAMGDLTQAQNQYDLLIQEVQKQVSDAKSRETEPSASLWYYMDAASLDLASLIAELEGNTKYWHQAPPANMVAGDHSAIRDFANQKIKELKEITIALEYTGQLPSEEQTIQVSPFVFGQITSYTEDGQIETFEALSNSTLAYGEETFSVQFDYDGPPTDQIIWRVYVNGYENPSLRKVFNQDISSGGTWYQTFGFGYTNIFILRDGEYLIELYINSQLVQSGVLQVR
jgi:tetratricopeptide (TPR) repeat protein